MGTTPTIAETGCLRRRAAKRFLSLEASSFPLVFHRDFSEAIRLGSVTTLPALWSIPPRGLKSQRCRNICKFTVWHGISTDFAVLNTSILSSPESYASGVLCLLAFHNQCGSERWSALGDALHWWLSKNLDRTRTRRSTYELHFIFSLNCEVKPPWNHHEIIQTVRRRFSLSFFCVFRWTHVTWYRESIFATLESRLDIFEANTHPLQTRRRAEHVQVEFGHTCPLQTPFL